MDYTHIALLPIGLMILVSTGEVRGLRCYGCQYDTCTPENERFDDFITECSSPNDEVCMLSYIGSGKDFYRSCASHSRCVPSETTFCCESDLCNGSNGDNEGNAGNAGNESNAGNGDKAGDGNSASVRPESANCLIALVLTIAASFVHIYRE